MVWTMIAKARLRSSHAPRRKQLLDDMIRVKKDRVIVSLQRLGILDRHDLLRYILEEESQMGIGLLADAALGHESSLESRIKTVRAVITSLLC